MKKAIYHITSVFPAATSFHLTMLVFRILVSVQLMTTHGLKKLGVGVEQAENIPNPLGLPEQLNSYFATAANLFFPVLVISGFFTRLAALPILAVTMTGYFVLHWNDSLLEKDMPFMYSVSFLLILVLGPGKYSIDHLINKKISY
ncbi:DoxX family protein [Terrimonas sp. NA20]|uniref:DoxX family protein n=1 Tax=Terrimonas ginsenosidimutans TaxID=2908004 RepID=A0ABS9KYP0_9BACT|nr:DoxX family protein [Terrimonas ginsenosidimutans]MCG2617435.1 DoxX family protein [Terrimonas ginsenosidimutans]